MWDALKAWLAGGAGDQLTALRFEFNTQVPVIPGMIAVVAAGVCAAWFWWMWSRKVRMPARLAIVALRTIAVMLVLFIALDPCITGQLPVPNEDFVVFLFDDSKSMQVKGDDGLSRGERVQQAYNAARADLETKLKQRHQLAFYSLGGSIERLTSIDNLSFEAPETNIVGGLKAAVTDLEGVRVSALVLLSDGVQQPADSDPALFDALPKDVPIFAVAADTVRTWSDLKLARYSATRTDFDKSPVVVTASIDADNLAGETAIVEVLDGERVVKTQSIPIEEMHDQLEARLEFIPSKKAWIEYTVRTRLEKKEPADPALAADEVAQPIRDPIDQNNDARFVIDNREKEFRVLYFTGRPNWESKFFRRAITEDETFRLVNLIRISKAETKFEYRGERSSLSNPLFEGFTQDQDLQPRYDESVFIRLGTSESELADGYPTKPEDLFPFDLLIIGDVEHNFFSLQHLELTRDFVERRGGVLLMLGGPHSFAEGQYSGSVLERMLPFVLSGDGESNAAAGESFNVMPTPEGLFTGVMSLDPNPDTSTARWMTMPPLYGLNRFALIRPGATVLAAADTGDPEGKEPWFAVQRYGEGKCAAVATGETWQWQMQRELDDESFQELWRQAVRYLVKDVPDQVMLRAKADSYEVAKPLTLDVLVRDREYHPAEGLRISAAVRPPTGTEAPVSVEESIQESGLYAIDYEPEAVGMHVLTISALDEKDEAVGTLEEAFLVAPDNREFQNPKLDTDFLTDLASHSGGAVMQLDGLASLANRIPWKSSQHADIVSIHLWHMPAIYALLAALFAAEWYLRRRRGQA